MSSDKTSEPQSGKTVKPGKTAKSGKAAKSAKASSPTITAAASRAPEPSVDRIEELAGRILRGDILLPKFQREFVWERHQIIDLLDSVQTIIQSEVCCFGAVARSYAVNGVSRTSKLHLPSGAIQ